MSEMNFSNDTRDGKEELELFCYYTVCATETKQQCYLKVDLD